MVLPKKISFVDIETTGVSIRFDKIIEIGIICVEDNKVASKYQTLIDPQIHIPNEIFNLTGITKKMLEKAPTFRSVSDEIYELLKDSIFVAHNARFDYSFIKNEFKRVNIPFSPRHFCTVKLSRLLYPTFQHHNLDSIIQRLGILCKNRHRAFDDAKVLWEFYQHIQKEFPKTLLTKKIITLLKKPSIPILISQKTIDSLPSSSGVYAFYGEKDVPLYVGKSINIKQRILSHFSNDHASSIEMKLSQTIKSIETISTCGELGALIKESQLIKTLKPMYNRRLRYSSKPVVVKKTQDRSGYNTIQIAEVDLISISALSKILGIFKSKKQAKDYLISLAHEHNLCDSLLCIENTNRACFGYRLNRCKGACIGKEKSLSYNLRFDNAFYKSKIKTWSFDGAIVIEEKDEESGSFEAFIVDKWCLVKSVKGNSDTVNTTDFNVEFDNDIYKILQRYILNPRNQIRIKAYNL